MSAEIFVGIVEVSQLPKVNIPIQIKMGTNAAAMTFLISMNCFM